jgi:hypothetical protein
VWHRWLWLKGEKLSRNYADDWLYRPSILNFCLPAINDFNRLVEASPPDDGQVRLAGIIVAYKGGVIEIA